MYRPGVPAARGRRPYASSTVVPGGAARPPPTRPPASYGPAAVTDFKFGLPSPVAPHSVSLQCRPPRPQTVTPRGDYRSR